MTDCWVNVMPKQVVHGLHLHPLSTISGTYGPLMRKLRSITNKTVNKEPKWRHNKPQLTTGYEPRWRA